MRPDMNHIKLQTQRFFQQYASICMAFAFLYIAGVAAGFSLNDMFCRAESANWLTGLLEGLKNTKPSMIIMTVQSLCLQTVWVSLMILSGACLPMTLLWPCNILLRGLFIGLPFAVSMQAFTINGGWLIVALLLLETVVTLPEIICLSVFTLHQAAVRIKASIKEHQICSVDRFYYQRCWNASKGLLVCVLMEGLVLPLLIQVFIIARG